MKKKILDIKHHLIQKTTSSTINRLDNDFNHSDYERKRLERYKHLYLSTFPKSGSTFLFLVLKELTGFRGVRLDYDPLREQDLYLPKLVKHQYLNTITKHHTLATSPNITLFRKFNIQPVVLVRNIFDVMVSLNEHISETKKWPTLHIPDEFYSLKIETRFDYLINNALPWYLFFYSSWWTSAKNNALPVLFITYEQMTSDLNGTIDKIFRFWSIETLSNNKKEDVSQKIKKQTVKSRFNKGVYGRGDRLLSNEQKRRFYDYIKHFPSIDFSLIGL